MDAFKTMEELNGINEKISKHEKILDHLNKKNDEIIELKKQYKEMEISLKSLEEKYSKLEINYNRLYDYLANNIEKVYTLATGNNMAYKEIYRQGSKLTREEESRGWHEQSWSIGYTLTKKMK